MMSQEARDQVSQENRERQGRQWDQSRQQSGGRGGRFSGGSAVQAQRRIANEAEK